MCSSSNGISRVNQGERPVCLKDVVTKVLNPERGVPILAQGKQTRARRAFVPPWVAVRFIDGRASDDLLRGGPPRPLPSAVRFGLAQPPLVMTRLARPLVYWCQPPRAAARRAATRLAFALGFHRAARFGAKRLSNGKIDVSRNGSSLKNEIAKHRKAQARDARDHSSIGNR